MKDVVLEPQEILALYASPNQVEKGETVMLGDIRSQNQNIFIVVETTCPLARSVEEEAWLPDGYSRIFRIVCVLPFGLLDYGSATLRCKI